MIQYSEKVRSTFVKNSMNNDLMAVVMITLSSTKNNLSLNQGNGVIATPGVLGVESKRRVGIKQDANKSRKKNNSYYT